MERVARIELAPTAWKAEVLPLNYTRDFSNPLIHRVFRASLRLSSPAFTDAYCFPARLTAESYHLWLACWLHCYAYLAEPALAVPAAALFAPFSRPTILDLLFSAYC